MAFSTILRRSAASLAPVGARLVHTQKRTAPALITALYHLTTAAATPVKPPATFSSFSSIHHFSSAAKAKMTSADEKLVSVLDDEIDSAETEEDPSFEIPNDFLFKVEDNPGEQTVTLTREFKGEKISVRVHMPDSLGGEEDASDDEAQPSVPLVVRVSKRNGQSLEFGCTAFEDEIAIDSLSFKEPGTSEDEIPYEGPDFSDLDENLQQAFQKYLEVRGIKPSVTNDLYGLMINKDSREYSLWLKNLKSFIEA